MTVKQAKAILTPIARMLEVQLRELDEFKDRTTNLFSKNWLNFEIGHRSPSSFASSLANYGVDDPVRLRRARRAEKEEADPDPEEKESDGEKTRSPENFDESQEWAYGARSAHELHLESLVTPSPLACARGIGDSDLIALFVAVIDDRSPGANLVRLQLATLAGFDQLARARLTTVQGQAFAVQKIVSPHERPPAKEAHLYRAAGPELYHRLDPRAELGLKFLANDPVRSKRDAAQFVERHVPRGTLAKLRRALTQLGPSICGYPWIFSHYGFEGTSPHTQAQKHYCVIDKLSYRSVFAYQTKYLGFPGDVGISSQLPACGALLVPRTETVRDLFSLLPQLVEEFEFVRPSADNLESYRLLAAIVHLLFLLFTGLRHRPMEPISWTMGMPGGWEIYLEKSGIPRPIRIFPPLGSLLSRIAAITDQLLARLPGIHDQPPSSCYLFPYVNLNGRVVFESPCHSVVRDSLAGVASTSAFADLARTSIRSWANTVLREQGTWAELDVRRMFTHQSRRQAPLSRSRLEAPWDETTNWAMCVRLAEEVGLWPWISRI